MKILFQYRQEFFLCDLPDGLIPIFQEGEGIPDQRDASLKCSQIRHAKTWKNGLLVGGGKGI